MATVTLTISAANLTRVVNALSVRFGYQATLPDGTANPQSASEFVRLQVIAKYVIAQTEEHELNTARAAVTVTDVVVT